MRAALLSSLPIAVLFLGLARWSEWRSAGAVLGRVVIVLVAAVPATMFVIGVGTMVGPPLMQAAGYAYGADGIPVVTGGVGDRNGMSGRKTMRITTSVAAVLAAFPRDQEEGHYGLELMRATGLPSGTLYPILVRLQDAGWVETHWEDVDPATAGRPARRYYRLTPGRHRVGSPGNRGAATKARRARSVGRRQRVDTIQIQPCAVL
ncbi:PadR family transcriptional regulator [Fodinicola acaciae]|uniref:PadR family transcriptional regulator n=1 Tax=Fodinicola acaciae TaxID=2681555 RepID=UPI001C9E8FAF|nr:PadR family transcriptional regulator [Fodinicola acaciae]